MKKKLKLLKDFMGQKAGTVIEVDEADVKSLIDGKVAVDASKSKMKLLKDFSGQKTGTVIEVDEADIKSLVDGKIAELADTDPAQVAVEELLIKLDKGMEDLTKKHLDRYIKAVGKATSISQASRVKMGIATARNDSEEGESWGYVNLGQFGMEVKTFGDKTKTVPERLAGYLAKSPSGMNETLGEEGGVLVPPQIGQGIYERAFDPMSLVATSDCYNLTGNTIEFPGLADNSRATGSRWGGVRGYWLNEAAQLTSSKPKFTNIKLRLHKLGVLVYMTDELMSDTGVALDQWMTRKAGDEINFMSSDALINGGGGDRPLGILNSPCLISVTRTTANLIKFADISNMWNRMFSPFRSGAVWYVNQEVEPQLDKLTFEVKNVAGTENVGGWPLYIPPGGLNSSPYGLLKGRPVIPIEWCAALGTAGDIILANQKQYLVGTKGGGIQSAMSIHLRFDYDETAFRFIYRIDGQPWWNKVLTPYKGTSTFSSFVALAA